jgi:urea transport system ATP-binding protein
MEVPGSRNLPPRPERMFPEVTPAMRMAESLTRLTGRSRSSSPPPRTGALLTGDPAEAGPDASRGVILYLEDLTVSFDGFKALNALTLYVATGELRCIIGPNGAGKTTMMDVITGKTRPDHGSAWFGQTLDLLTLTEPEIAEAGIGRKFQKPTVFEKHSAFENLELALAGSRSVWRNLVAKLNSEQRDRISEVLRLIGLAAEADRPAGVLSHGQKQWLEIGMLLMQNPRLLLVDEPVAGMTPQEVERTAELLVSLSGAHSVVVVEHDMEFVRRIARKVTVLHQGSVLAEGTMDEVQANPKVVEVYLGES